MGLYVQYGCGLSSPASWRNFDVSPMLRLQRMYAVGRAVKAVLPNREGFPLFPDNVEYGDIVKGLPVPGDSCSGMYCSHVLEHLSLDDFRRALANTHRHMKRGGVFRLVVPDLEHLARSYLSDTQADASLRFMEGSHLGQHQRPRTLLGLLRGAIGNSRHLWMWDYKSLREELLRAGVADVRRAELGDSGDPLFADVEDPERWAGSVAVHCTK